MKLHQYTRIYLSLLLIIVVTIWAVIFYYNMIDEVYDSLKAKFTAEGNRRLRAYCAEKGIATNNCAKVVVARDESELPGLEDLARRGERVQSGVRLSEGGYAPLRRRAAPATARGTGR